MKLFLAIMLFCIAGLNVHAQSVQIGHQMSAAMIIEETDTKVNFIGDSTSGKLTVCVHNPSRKNIRIMLYKDGMRFCYRTSSVNYKRCFNFSNADAGPYQLSVSNGNRVSKKQIIVESYNSQE